MIFSSLFTLLNYFPFILAGLVGLAFLIAFHEFGHFLFCKLFNIYTPSFSIGFGPVLFSKMIGDTLFKLSLIPLGGYVEIAGAQEVGQGEQAHAQLQDERSFGKKPFWQQFAVMIGGILFNLIFAYLVFIAIFFVGTPKTQLLYPTNATTKVAHVIPQSAADGKIMPGDMIKTINKLPLEKGIATYLHRTTELSEADVEIVLERNGNNITTSLKPKITSQRGQQTASMGIIFETESEKAVSLFDAIKRGITETHRWIGNIINDFKHLSLSKNVKEMAGPLMIVHMSAKMANEGILLFFIFLAIISINLAVLNMLPVPILDGGQIVFYTIEAIIGFPLNEKAKLGIHMACWIGFMALFAYLSWQDIMRIAAPLLKHLF